MFSKLGEVSGGTFRVDVHTILADDEHGVALVTNTIRRGGGTAETQHANIFHFRGGKVVEFWGASTDQYSGDEVLG